MGKPLRYSLDIAPRVMEIYAYIRRGSKSTYHLLLRVELLINVFPSKMKVVVWERGVTGRCMYMFFMSIILISTVDQ